MPIPGGISLFQIIAIVLGIISFWVSLKSLNDAQSWNNCAPTLNLNHCPPQSPKQTFKCQIARRQMDSFLRSKVQNFGRKSPKQRLSFYTLGGTLVITILGFVCYYLLPLNGQLCLAKAVNFTAFSSYILASYWIVSMVIEYNQQPGPYGGFVCALHTTLPQQDFGDVTLKTCFQDFHICQNAILDLFGVVVACIAAFVHFLAFFSAVWDCHTQVDHNDWGNYDDIPEDYVIIRPEPPVYFVESEQEKQTRIAQEKLLEQQEDERRRVYEKKRMLEEKTIEKEQKRLQSIRQHQAREERAKQAKLEKKRKKEEKKLAKLEEKRLAKEEEERQIKAEEQLEEARKEEEKRLKQQQKLPDKTKESEQTKEQDKANQISPDINNIAPKGTGHHHHHRHHRVTPPEINKADPNSAEGNAKSSLKNDSPEKTGKKKSSTNSDNHLNQGHPPHHHHRHLHHPHHHENDINSGERSPKPSTNEPSPNPDS